MNKKDLFLINKNKFLPLSKASHYVGINKKKVTKNNPSEWVWAYAMLSFKQDQEVTSQQVADELNKAQLEEVIVMAMEDGLLDMSFSEEKNDFVFFLTEKGSKNVDNL